MEWRFISTLRAGGASITGALLRSAIALMAVAAVVWLALWLIVHIMPLLVAGLVSDRQ